MTRFIGTGVTKMTIELSKPLLRHVRVRRHQLAKPFAGKAGSRGDFFSTHLQVLGSAASSAGSDGPDVHIDLSDGATKTAVRWLQRHFVVTQADKFPKRFAELPEATVCAPEIYEEWAQFLQHEYVIKTGEHKGEPLSIGSVIDYLNALINVAGRRYRTTGTDASRLFLTCQDQNSGTDSARWINGLRKNVRRTLFEGKRGKGMSMMRLARRLWRLRIIGRPSR